MAIRLPDGHCFAAETAIFRLQNRDNFSKLIIAPVVAVTYAGRGRACTDYAGSEVKCELVELYDNNTTLHFGRP